MSESRPPLAAGGTTSGAANGSPPCRRRPLCEPDWAILDRIACVASESDFIRGTSFSVERHAPPLPSTLAISRAVLPRSESRRCGAFLHCVETSGHLLLCSAAVGGHERLVVCQAGTGRTFVIPSVPESMEPQLSMRDCIGIVDDPDDKACGNYGYVVAQLHRASTSAPSATAQASKDSLHSTPPEAAPDSKAASSATAPKSSAPASPPRATAPASTPSSSATASGSPARASTPPVVAAAGTSAPASMSPATEPASPLPATVPASTPSASATASGSPARASTPPVVAPAGPSTPASMSLATEPASPPPASATAPESAAPSSTPPILTVHHFRFSLLFFTSSEDSWSVKEFTIASPCNLSVFSVDTVLSLAGSVAFVDMSCGIIACDPILEQFVFVEFPTSCCHPGVSGASRCISVSEDRIRLIAIDNRNNSSGINMWMLPDGEGEEWTMEFDHIPFREIWENQSYQHSGLPLGVVPSLGLIDPNNHYIVYMIIGNQVFSVNLESAETIAWAPFFVDLGTGPKRPNSCTDICSWVIPLPPNQAPPVKSTAKAALKAVKSGSMYWGRRIAKTIRDKKPYIEAFAIATDLSLAVAGYCNPYAAITCTALNETAERVVKVLHIDELTNHRSHGLATPAGLNLDAVVGNEAEAEKAIEAWVQSGKPANMYIQLAPGLHPSEVDGLRAYFISQGAENMFQYVDCWMGTYDNVPGPSVSNSSKGP